MVKIQPKIAIQSNLPDLAGKTVLMVGSEIGVVYYAEALKEAGVDVIYPRNNPPGGLTPRAGEAVAQEVLAMDQKPDAVLVFQPRMKYVVQQAQAPFSQDPTVKLAEALKPLNLPFLVLDVWSLGELEKAEQAVMQKAGITYRCSSDVRTFQAVPILAQMIGDKGKSGAAGALTGGAG